MTDSPQSITSSSGNFATNEIWVGDSSFDYWVEVGFIANYASVNGVKTGVNEFWFDSRPGGGQHGHNLVTNPTFKPRTFYIVSDGSDSFTASDSTYSGESTSNSMTPAQAEFGSESTTSQACTYSHDYTMAYSTGSGWVDLPTAVQTIDAPQVIQWNTKWTDMYAGIPC